MAPGVLPEGSVTAVVRQLCLTASSGPVPVIGQVSGQKYQSTKADWSNATDVSANSGFPCLRFEMTAPQYYSYMYTQTGTPTANPGVFAATANGNLNGDTNYSTFELDGAISTSGRCNLAPNIKEVSPEE